MYNEKSLEISKKLGCAVILGWEGKYDDPNDFTYSIYANEFAKGNETKNKIFFKNTSTPKSLLSCENYEDYLDCLVDPIILNDKKIGMTICYDCNHSAFSRGYKESNIDILINSSGGNVVYHKWYRYNKVRAIENKCFNFCTIGFKYFNFKIIFFYNFFYFIINFIFINISPFTGSIVMTNFIMPCS